jgi:nucleotide-binding universal stress UspA family protein
LIKELIFPVDFSERSAETSAYLEALAGHLGASVTLLHVLEPLPRGSSMLDRMYLSDENERKEAAERELAELQQQQITQVPATTRVLVGDAATAIVDYAGEGATRLIAMPTRGFVLSTDADWFGNGQSAARREGPGPYRATSRSRAASEVSCETTSDSVRP